MSYLTRVTGCIAVTPPLIAQTIRDVNAELGDDPRLRLPETIERENVPLGILTRVTCDLIEPIHGDPFRARDIADQLRAAVRVITAVEPTTTFRGFLEGQGERDDDRWRLYVEDGTLTEARAEIVWPEGPW